MKHIVRVTMLICLSMMITTTIFAGNKKKDGDMNTDPPPEEFTIQSVFDGVLLMDGSNHVDHLGGNEVDFGGWSEAYHNVDEIYIYAVLQRWTGSTWASESGLSSTRYDDDFVYVKDSVFVPTGYYYRTKSTHEATDDGVTESGQLTSSAISVPN